MLLLLRPKNGSYVSLASEYQTDFCTEGAKRLRADMDAEQLKFMWNDVAPGQDRDEHSHPAPVCFEWRDRPCEIGHNNRKIYTFLLCLGFLTCKEIVRVEIFHWVVDLHHSK